MKIFSVYQMARMGLIGFSILLSHLARADMSAELAEASAALAEGVPEVAGARLEALVSKNLPDPEWRAVTEKLAEAEVAARQPEEALVLLADSRLRDIPWAKFWRAQAFASLHRWADALPLYEELAADRSSPLHGPASFGAAEMLRALGRRDEALTKLTVLLYDKEWAIRGRLRSAELYIDKADAINARRVLDEMRAKSVADRTERRLLRGRLELILQRPERAIGIFQALLKKPEGAPHATLMAGHFRICGSHRPRKTPGSGSGFTEPILAE